MTHKLDEWDRRIVSILQRDGRASNVDIARELGLAEATVRKRIERLLESGIIRVRAVADPESLGLTTRMMIAIQTDQTELESVADRLASIQEVLSVSIVTGTYDVIIEVALPSSGQLLSFILDKVVTIPGVKRTDTYHVLKVVKQANMWGLPDQSVAGSGQPSRRSSTSDKNVVPGSIVIPS